MRNIIHLGGVLLTGLFLLFSNGCKSEKSEDPVLPAGRWDVRWSYTLGNPLVGGSPGSIQTQWKDIFQSGTAYDFRPIWHNTLFVPSDAGLDWNILEFQMGKFLRQFYQNDTTFDHIRSRYSSFLLGVNTPLNTPPNATDTTDAYGVTIPFGILPPDVDSAAVSLVFTTKIFAIPGLDTEGKWRVVQYVVIHELGHARGLNASTPSIPEYDHIYHGGQLIGWCVMRLLYLPERSLHNFCDFHKRVLRACLPIIKATYEPTDICTYP